MALCQASILVFSHTFLCHSAIQKGMVTQGNMRKHRTTAEMGNFQREQNFGEKRQEKSLRFPNRKPGSVPAMGCQGLPNFIYLWCVTSAEWSPEGVMTWMDPGQG